MMSALYSSISNTWKWASDYYGLITLVSLTNEDRSYNPYSEDFFWISRNAAVTILQTLEFPYDNCSSITEILDACDEPKIEYAIRMFDMVDEESQANLYDMIKFLIERGEPIDAYSSDGLTALHYAILVDSPELTALLLKSGADRELTVKFEGRFYGKDAIGLAKLLSNEHGEKILEILLSVNSSASNQISLPT